MPHLLHPCNVSRPKVSPRPQSSFSGVHRQGTHAAAREPIGVDVQTLPIGVQRQEPLLRELLLTPGVVPIREAAQIGALAWPSWGEKNANDDASLFHMLVTISLVFITFKHLNYHEGRLNTRTVEQRVTQLRWKNSVFGTSMDFTVKAYRRGSPQPRRTAGVCH